MLVDQDGLHVDMLGVVSVLLRWLMAALTACDRSAQAVSPNVSLNNKMTNQECWSKGPYTLTSFLEPVAGASQLAPVNWRVCHGTRISLVPVTGTSRF